MPMTYTDDIQKETILHKMRLVLDAMHEYASGNDEALDAYKRESEPMEYRTGFEWGAPAWLSFYRGTGTGTPFQDKLIERSEQAQADEWARQYPHRAGLFACYEDEEGEFSAEAEEWIDAALADEAIFLNLETELRDSYVIIRARFSNGYNKDVGGKDYERRIDQDEFLALAGADLETLVTEAIDTAYKSED